MDSRIGFKPVFSETHFRIQQKTSWVMSQTIWRKRMFWESRPRWWMYLGTQDDSLRSVSETHINVINDRFNCEYHPFHNAKSKKKNAFPVSSGPWHNQTRCNSKVYSTKQTSEIIKEIVGGSSPASSNRRTESAGVGAVTKCSTCGWKWLTNLYPIIHPMVIPLWTYPNFHKFPIRDRFAQPELSHQGQPFGDKQRVVVHEDVT